MNLNDPDFRALVTAHDHRRELLRVTRPSDGIANEVYVLNTSRGYLVLKVFAEDVGMWKPQKELAVFTHMDSIGIPVPAIHRIDTSRQIVPFIYSLSARIEGKSFSHVFSSLSDGENMTIYASLGDYLGKLHATTFEQFGDVQATRSESGIDPINGLTVRGVGKRKRPYASWAALHSDIVHAQLARMQGTAFEDLIGPTQTYFDKHREVIDFAVVPRLLHMDLHRRNILITNSEVSGILDVEESIVGHNEYDLMRTELANFRGQDPTWERSFMRAYSRHIGLDDGYESRKGIYDTSRTLAWIRSLVLYGERDKRGHSDLAHQAARAHLLALIAGP